MLYVFTYTINRCKLYAQPDVRGLLGTVKSKDNAYYEYQLSVSSNLIKSVALITGLFNVLLIIPDIINITDPLGKFLMTAERSIFSILALLVFVYYKRIKTFKALSVIVSLYELAAGAIFMHVLSLYPSPDFLIQAFGVFTLIIVVYLVPNYLGSMIAISVSIGTGFFILSYLNIEVRAARSIAAAAYMLIEIVLCSVCVYSINRYKRKEFSSHALLKSIYNTDPLTKVGNRVKLEEEAAKWISFCGRQKLELSLALIDVDNLKMINDEYGHLVGDAVLYELAQIMKSQLRKHDVFVRWGGDEFVLLLPDTGIEQARMLIERVRASIQEKQFETDIAVTCSFGIAAMKEGLSFEQLMLKADEFMYNAKKQGKDAIGIVNCPESL